MFNLLQAVWSLSFVLAALSCGVMAALILARLVRQKRDQQLPARSVKLTLDLLAYGKGEIDAPQLKARSGHERDLILKTALGVARALEGENLERVVKLMRSASLDVHYRRLAVRGHIPDRVAAIENLRMFRDADTLRELRLLQDSATFRICVAAMRTSIELGDPPDLDAVLKLVERPEGERSLALFKIVEVCAHANLPVALARLAAGLPRESQVMMLKAIGTSRSPMAFTAITRSTNDMDPEVRAAAITALRALGVPGVAPWFIAALRDADWRVRLKAVEGLGQYGASEDRTNIEPLLNDSVWWIRFRAGEALQRLEQAASVQDGHQRQKPAGKPRIAASKTRPGTQDGDKPPRKTARTVKQTDPEARPARAPPKRRAAS